MHVLWRIFGGSKRIGVSKCFQVSYFLKYSIFPNSMEKYNHFIFLNFFRVAEALILGTMMVGQCTAFAPNYNKAVLAAARVFRYSQYQTKKKLFLQI